MICVPKIKTAASVHTGMLLSVTRPFSNLSRGLGMRLRIHVSIISVNCALLAGHL